MAAGTETAPTSLVERFKEEAVSRKAELQPAVDEYNQIEEFLSTFSGGTRRRSAARSSSSGGSTGSRRGRAANGPNRHDQFLAVVEGQPGITIPQIAEKINDHLGEGERPVSSNYLYRVRDALTKEGKITPEGDGFKAAKK